MVHVAPGSRSPLWSQNQVKVLIDRESSFISAPQKLRARYFFSNSIRFSAQPPSVVMLRRLPASILLLSAFPLAFLLGSAFVTSLPVQDGLCAQCNRGWCWQIQRHGWRAEGAARRSAAHRLRLAGELALQLQGRSCPAQCAAFHACGPWPRAATHRGLQKKSA